MPRAVAAMQHHLRTMAMRACDASSSGVLEARTSTRAARPALSRSFKLRRSMRFAKSRLYIENLQNARTGIYL